MEYKMSELVQELGTNFIEYAVAVNTDRSIPDAMSGLKPVARRILYGAYKNGYLSTKTHVKNAEIVGCVMGTYHPHGDSSIYGALVRLAQDWVMRYPLIDFHGNVGNIAGDGPAAYRYTEGRLAKISEDGMLNGIKKNNVDFIPNYSESTEEPITLPAIFPNLLCNPNSGIGVAMACNWLPHNLSEVAQAIYDFLDGKAPMLPGPDFPTGGVVINSRDIPNIMATGKGSVKIRGRYKIEKQNIIFYEIPYGVKTEQLIEDIGKLADEGELPGLADIRDESNKKGLRIVFECEKNIMPESIVAKLFSKSDLQTSISYNQIALVGKTPTELNLKDCIKIYVDHNTNCIEREAKFDLDKALARLEVLNGLLRALEDIDNIIALIKKSESSSAAKDNLTKIYNFTENQAKAIVEMKLGRLANLERIELNTERDQLTKDIEELSSIINSNDKRKAILRERLSALVKKYGDKRRTELLDIEIPKAEKEIEEVIPEDVVVIMTKAGSIKRIPLSSFKIQKRGGKGVKTVDDTILDTISTNTIDTLMLFTDKGRMYRLLVDKIPVGNNTSKGESIASYIKIDHSEKVIAITSLNRKTNPEFVVFITKNGIIKKTYLEEYTKSKRNVGINAITLKDNDTIVDVKFMDKEELILFTKKGMSIRFATDTINPIGKIAVGVKSIKLDDNDEVIAGLSIKKTDKYVALFTKNGYASKISLNEFQPQGRCGKGIIGYKTSTATGDLVGVVLVSEDDDSILVIGKPNSICFLAKDISQHGRSAAGVQCFKNNTTITSIVKI